MERERAKKQHNCLVEALGKDLGLEEQNLIRVRRDEKVAAFRRHRLKKHTRTNSNSYHRQHRTASSSQGREGCVGVHSAPWEFILPTCVF